MYSIANLTPNSDSNLTDHRSHYALPAHRLSLGFI